MSTLRWALVEWDIVWKNPQENLQKIEKILPSLKNGCDVIALPEMFTTGFLKNPEDMAEAHPGPTLAWMQSMAENFQIALCGSIAAQENQQIFNRFYWVNPDKTYFTYDKKHLFRLASEHKNYKAGKNLTIVSYKQWKIKPLICYDLRFPVWARNRYENDAFEYDLLIYPANWPTNRIHIWETLLKARSIENMCITIGINRTGVDGNGWAYAGQSMVCFPDGTLLPSEEMRFDDVSVKLVEMDLNRLNQFRESFPVALDWDNFEISLI